MWGEIFNYVSKKNFDYTVLQDSLLFPIFNTLILKDAWKWRTKMSKVSKIDKGFSSSSVLFGGKHVLGLIEWESNS